MLKIRVVAIGKVKDAWMRDGIAEYQKRLSAFCKLEIVELDEYRLPDNPSEAEILRGMQEEGARILKKTEGMVCPLCIEGEMLSSESLAALLEQAAGKSGAITFVIGGSFGLADEVKKAGQKRVSFSRMTFPHQLMRVILCEQLYRACSINAGGKYHK